MPGRAGGMAPNGRTATHTGKYSLSETDVQRSANDANGAWAAGPINGPEEPAFAGASGRVGAELVCLQFRRRARD